ncbi:MAG: BatA domain-containing protein [Acidobacteria bacterium]|nr:BatA domain-containing protein [Acidobacteriota bacterium]
MSFLTPLFLLGLAALAVPVLIHLTQRERTSVVAFPSLMFIKKIPYESVRRRRIRDWLLLALRAAALALIVAAFARPFVRGSTLAADASGAREIVLLLDRSYSLSADDTWTRTRQAAVNALGNVGPLDRVSLITFASTAELVLRSSADASRVTAAIETAQPSAGATRYAPALKLASSVLAESTLPQKQAILVSDFQRAGWQADEAFRLPAGSVFTPVVVEPTSGVNLSATPLAIQRVMEGAQSRVVVTAGVVNRSATTAASAKLDLEVDGRVVQSASVKVEPASSAATTFAPIAMPGTPTRVSSRLSADALAADNAFHAVVAPARPVTVALVGAANRAAADLYLTRALSIGDRPRFEVTTHQADALTADLLARTNVVILQDLPIGDALATRLQAFVEGGGGLVLALGSRVSVPDAPWWPAAIGGVDDRTRGAAAKLSGFDYGHVVFEPFRAPRSGDFSTTRVYGYRQLTARPGAVTLARFDGGSPALVDRSVGRGHVLMWATSLDLSWSDLALKPVYLPFVHQLVRYAAGYREDPGWLTVGQAIDAGDASAVVLSPSGQRWTPTEGTTATELTEAGFYDVRGAREGQTIRTVASNVELAESDVTPLDPAEVAAAVTGQPGGTPDAPTAVAIPDGVQEQAQRLWWYLLFAGILLLIAESWLARRLAPVRP